MQGGSGSGAAEAGFDLATVDRLLSTTRAVRRRLDLARPVPAEVLRECLALSQQAPTGSNQQGWRWVIVTDPKLRRQIGEIYARGIPAIVAHGKLTVRDAQTQRVYEGALWLAEHFGEVPVHALACVLGRPPERFDPTLTATLYGSVLQAVWSFQLALRSRGLGSVYTTLHLAWEAEMAELLGIPKDVTQVGLLPVAYTKGGEFRPAQRPPVDTIAFGNRWGGSLG
jgi:nitroreductase